MPSYNTQPRLTESEQHLLAELRDGSSSAVREWYQLYSQRLIGWLGQRISNSADAEEVAQEVFLNCLKHLPLFRGESSLWSWMLGIARHEVADYYRKRYAKKAIAALPLTELVSVSDISDAHEVAEKVKTVFARLSADAQELLLMKYVDNKSVKDIAAELGRTIKAVESDLFRARRDFRYYFVELST